MEKIKCLLVLLVFYSCNKADTYRFPELASDTISQSYSISGSDTTLIIRESKHVILKGKLRHNRRIGVWEQFTSFSKDSLTFFKSGLFNYYNDLKSGPYKLYNPKGKIWLLGSYKKELPDSLFVYFDIRGDLDKVEYWKADTNSNSSELVYSRDF